MMERRGEVWGSYEHNDTCQMDYEGKDGVSGAFRAEYEGKGTFKSS